MKKSSKRRGCYIFILSVGFLLLVGWFLLSPPWRIQGGRGHIKIRAKNTLTSLVSAVDAYFNAYNTLPTSPSSPPTADAIVTTTDGPVFSALSGESPDGMNLKKTVFFTGVEARGASAVSAYGGVWKTSTGSRLFDPWQKSPSLERGYFLLIDYDYDGKLLDPFHPGRVISRRVVAWSAGKDGKWERGDTKKGVNKDNVYSWF